MNANDRPQWLMTLLCTALAGGGGGVVGYILARLFAPFAFDVTASAPRGGVAIAIWDSLLFTLCGTAISLAVLAADNVLSLRGRWSRDLKTGLWFFSVGSFLAGLVSSCIYSVFSATRAVPWAIAGAVIGAGLGALRKDATQSARAALGGAIGGALSGLLVDGSTSYSYTEAALAMGTLQATLITGSLIGLFMQVVQGALKTAWLIGASTGPYEGRQYLLNTDRVTVGASELHDISLYRNSELRVPTGALVKTGGTWRWQGEPAEINGVAQTDAPLASGDTIKLGRTDFRFRTKTGVEESAASFAAGGPPPAAPVFSPAAPAPQAAPAPPGVRPQSAAGSPVAPVPLAPAPNQRPQITAKGGWQLLGIAGSIPLPAPPGRATVGRADSNDIVLTDSSISSQHALIETYPYALKVKDLQSTNGVSVNGVRMPAGAPAILHDGDVMLLGEQSFQVKRTGQ